MEVASVRDASAIDAWQPEKEALITCYIFHKTVPLKNLTKREASEFEVRPSSYTSEVELWQSRTYHIFRDSRYSIDGWALDVGEGGYFYMDNWNRFVVWFEKMRPINIEILIS